MLRHSTVTSNMEPDKLQNSFDAGDQDGQSNTRLTSGQGQSDSIAKPYISDDKLQPGDIVGENYVIIELLGVGGMGYVYKVRHLILEKIYAMKTIGSDQVSEMAWRRLQVEAQAIARINHPNIVGIHNLGVHNGAQQNRIPYYVMDYLKGENLAEILRRKRHLSLEASLPLFIEICKGLGYAHKKGIVHRDIKPGNIVILDQPDFSGARVKLVDFGIAKLAGTVDPDNQKLTTVGEVFGSPLYMSPEQCEGKRIDARSDIYSLGCTFFETLTGDAPFHGENPVATMLMHTQTEPPTLYEGCGIDFPESMEKLVATMLAKAPMNRYPNLERVAEDLQKIMEGGEIGESPFAGPGSGHRSGDDSHNNQSKTVADTRAIKAIASITPIKIAALAALLVVSLVSIALYFTNQRTIDTTTAVATKALVKTAPSAPVEKYSQVLSDGYVRFNFPEKQSLGTISTHFNDKKGVQAQSSVSFRKDAKLYFMANDYAIAHPEIFDSFRADDLHAITAPQNSMVTDVNKGGQDTDVNRAIAHIGNLTGLKHLGLDVTNASDSAIEDLNKLVNLRVLKLNNTDMSGAGLSKLKRLKNLTSLSFSHNNDCKDMLKALAGSTEIDSLYLEGQNIDEEAAKLLASCKNLRHLDIEASSANDRVLEILADMPHIDFIGITACPISQACIDKVKKVHAGKRLDLARAKNVRTTLDKSFGGENPADWFLTK